MYKNNTLQVDLMGMIENQQLQSALGKALTLVVILVIGLFLYQFITRYVKSFFEEKIEIEEKASKRLVLMLNIILLSVIGLFTFNIFGEDFPLFKLKNLEVSITFLMTMTILFLLAKLIDWLLGYIVRRNQAQQDYSVKKYWTKQKVKKEKYNLATYIFVAIVASTLIRAWGDFTLFTFDSSLVGGNNLPGGDLIDSVVGGSSEEPAENITTSETGRLAITGLSVLNVIVIVLMAKLIALFVTNLLLESYYRSKEINIGAQFSINQIVTYLIYIIAFFVAFKSLGFHMTVIWGSLAALLIGLGLGLQQTFNDFFSGLLLLVERSIEVGDVVDVDGEFGLITEIGLRASVVKTRDDVHLIVPNSRLVVQKVSNYTHFDKKTRDHIVVGVAYDSDPLQVKEILLDCVKDYERIFVHPSPSVHFKDFGDSALIFYLHFYTDYYMEIEGIKSDIRFRIFQKLKEAKIGIPFPQMDVWFKNELQNLSPKN